MPLSSKFSATANDLRRNSDLSPLRHRPTAHRLGAVASDRHSQPPKCPCSQLVRPLRLSFGPRSVSHHSTQALRRFSSYARPPKPLCVHSNCTALPCPACEPPDQRRFRSSHTRAFKTPQPLVPVAPHSDLSLFHDLSSAESLQMLRAVLQTAVRSVMNSSASKKPHAKLSAFPHPACHSVRIVFQTSVCFHWHPAYKPPDHPRFQSCVRPFRRLVPGAFACRAVLFRPRSVPHPSTA